MDLHFEFYCSLLEGTTMNKYQLLPNWKTVLQVFKYEIFWVPYVGIDLFHNRWHKLCLWIFGLCFTFFSWLVVVCKPGFWNFFHFVFIVVVVWQLDFPLSPGRIVKSLFLRTWVNGFIKVEIRLCWFLLVHLMHSGPHFKYIFFFRDCSATIAIYIEKEVSARMS